MVSVPATLYAGECAQVNNYQMVNDWFGNELDLILFSVSRVLFANSMTASRCPTNGIF